MLGMQNESPQLLFWLGGPLVVAMLECPPSDAFLVGVPWWVLRIKCPFPGSFWSFWNQKKKGPPGHVEGAGYNVLSHCSRCSRPQFGHFGIRKKKGPRGSVWRGLLGESW